MVAKTVYDLYWKPSFATLAVMVVMIAAIMYLPYQLQLPIFLNPLLAVLAQISFCVGITIFFYSGIKLSRLFKVLMLLILSLSIFGFVSNLFHQATFLVSSRMLASDWLIVGLVNLAAVATTLSCYRMKQSKVEIPDGTGEPPNGRYVVLRYLTPVVYLMPIVATLAVIYNSRYVPNGASFAINVPFFIATQIVLNVGGAFFIFKEKSRREKLRLSFGVMSLAMLYGAFGNYFHQLTALRPGLRLVLNSTEFIAMNAGALVTMITIVNWNKYLEAERLKYLSYKSSETVAPPSVPSATDNTGAKRVDKAAPEPVPTDSGALTLEPTADKDLLADPANTVVKTQKKTKEAVTSPKEGEQKRDASESNV